MNNLWAFLPMRESNELLGDPEALAGRLDEDSYLLFRRVLDPDRITRLRRQILTIMAEAGWIKPRPLMTALSIGQPVREGDDGFFKVYDRVQRLEELHALAHDDALMAIMRDVVGESAFPHPLNISRLSFPGHYEVSTPPHQDYPNNQGTEHLTAAWLPFGDISRELGGLAVLRGSHHHGLLPLEVHLGAGNRQAHVPEEMLEALRWVTTDFEVGDVLVFPSLTVHAAMHNASEFNMRVSVDYRYQAEGEALTEVVLQPHFQRQSWAEIYAGWKSDRYQYYWEDRDYEVVAFEDYEIMYKNLNDTRPLRTQVMYELRRDARWRRRRDSIEAKHAPTEDRDSG